MTIGVELGLTSEPLVVLICIRKKELNQNRIY